MAEKKNKEAVNSAQKPVHKGTENLIPLNKRTKDEQREIQSNGGKKSGEVRLARKTFKEEFTALLEGVNNKGESNNKAITMALMQRALRGDTKAFEIIRDTIGEKPTDKVDINADKDISVSIKVVD